MQNTSKTTPAARWSIRRQLLVAVNTTLIGLVAVFLIFEYRHQLQSRMAEKRVALEEEAKTLLPAVTQLRPYGPVAVQTYIDQVCGQMQERQSPGHHIAVQMGTETLQATAHHRASPEMFHIMQRASMARDGRAHEQGIELVAGRAVDGDLVVYISESLRNVRAAVRREIVRHSIGVIVLAAALALIINVTLVRIVTRPMKRLVHGVRRIGRGELGTELGRFDSAELDYLAREITSMSIALAAADRNRMIQMRKAREIQQHLLPDTREIPGLTLASLFHPAEEVGGDFYDVISLGPGLSLFCLADVTGHGVPAAMTAAMLKSFLADAVQVTHDPDTVLEYINRRFIDVSLTGDFATMLVACIDVTNGTLSYANAGHEPAWLLRAAGNAEILATTGLILGIREETTWSGEIVPIHRGDRLLMVTDGVTETQGQDNTGCFGRERLIQIVKNTARQNLEEVVRSIETELNQFRGEAPPHDDVTLVIVEIADSPEGVRN